MRSSSNVPWLGMEFSAHKEAYYAALKLTVCSARDLVLLPMVVDVLRRELVFRVRNQRSVDADQRKIWVDRESEQIKQDVMVGAEA